MMEILVVNDGHEVRVEGFLLIRSVITLTVTPSRKAKVTSSSTLPTDFAQAQRQLDVVNAAFREAERQLRVMS